MNSTILKNELEIGNEIESELTIAQQFEQREEMATEFAFVYVGYVNSWLDASSLPTFRMSTRFEYVIREAMDSLHCAVGEMPYYALFTLKGAWRVEMAGAMIAFQHLARYSHQSGFEIPASIIEALTQGERIVKFDLSN